MDIRNLCFLQYLEDGRCSLSNNWSENSVRPITVGRKNWLFSTSVDGANASMGIYTIVEMDTLLLCAYVFLVCVVR